MKEDCVLIYLKHDLPGGAAGVQIKVPLDPALLPKLRTLTHEQATDLMPELAVAVEKVLLERLSAFGSLRDPSTKEET